MIAAAKCLQERGAYKVYAVATHGLFSKNACELLEDSALTEVCATQLHIMCHVASGRLWFLDSIV